MKPQNRIVQCIICIIILAIAIIIIQEFSFVTEAKNINNVVNSGQTNSENSQEDTQDNQENNIDLVLRKAIVEVKDKEGNIKNIVNQNKENATRNIVVSRNTNNSEEENINNHKGGITNNGEGGTTIPKDTDNNEKSSTETKDIITYEYRKDPVTVEKGDTVKYTITIYNEGKEAGYARKIVDQLPGTPTTGLRLLNTKEVTSTSGNVYTIEYSTTTNTVTFIQKNEEAKAIPGYKDNKLSRETITLECQVMTDIDTKQPKILTNIAYISEKYNEETKEKIQLIEDKKPTYQNENDTKQDGITYGKDIGYTANEKEEDYEKVVILPQSFDLSLRTVITEVDGEETEEERKITIEGIEQLKKGETTTAKYNHTKAPVVAKNGSTITYNIRIYNEASIEGIASIIKYQLSTGIKLDYTSLQTQLIEGKTQYYTITEKGNKYIVQYDEGTNTIIFILDEGTKVTNLEAFSIRETLDVDTIEFEGIVECIADETSNIYLTSIAYIYEEKKADGTIVTNQVGEDRDSEPSTIKGKTAEELRTKKDIGYIGNQENPKDLSQKETHYKGQQDDDDFEKIVILPQVFDLKLVSYVEKVNDEEAGQRIIKVDTSNLNKTTGNGEVITTAKYEMEKNPISVKGLDLVKYTFRVYNEGNYDGYVEEISEEIPQGLEALMIGKNAESGIIIYSWNGKELTDITEEIKETNMYDEIIETNSMWGYNADNSIIKTVALKDEKIKAFGIKDYEGYADKENKIDYKEISVIFRVAENLIPSENPIKNEAAITACKAVDENNEEVINSIGQKIQDRDSNPNKWRKQDSGKNYNTDGWAIYQEDDEDYDNIIEREFDFSLRTQLTKITRYGKDIEYTDRYAKIDTEMLKKLEQEKQARLEKEELAKLEQERLAQLEQERLDKIEQAKAMGIETTDISVMGTLGITNTNNAEDSIDTNNTEIKEEQLKSEVKTIYDYYEAYKNRPKVRVGDIITYTIRVYNEGEVEGYASVITNTIPSGLELVPYTEGDGSINEKYGWKLVEGTTNIYETDYLSYKNDKNKGNEETTIIKSRKEVGEVNYKEVEIQCKVKENITKDDSLLSIAQIADDSDDKGNPVRDKDSTTTKDDDERNWKEEDDLDIEVLQLEEFDLTLKQFITQVEKTETKDKITQTEESEITNRIPKLSYDKETKQIKYTQTKEPLLVNEGETVIYTIRVYNEGDIDGYVQEITNDVSEYLEFIPEHKVNQEFEWKMYDKKGNETEDVEKATKIKTRYLEENLIKAFNLNAGANNKKLDYQDVKIAFKVKSTKSSKDEIQNFAQITEAVDKEGNKLKDRDSQIGNGEGTPKEDDEDIEIAKIECFDLSLSEYITKVIITEDGNQIISETGNTGKTDDIVPQIEINKNKIKNTTVKFAYTIKVSNEGNIAGYAKKITNSIPEGLEFNIEDNPDWVKEENGVISTNQLENILIYPEETVELEVILAWENRKNNLGAKVITAEISEIDCEEKDNFDVSKINQQKYKENDKSSSKIAISTRTWVGLKQIYINVMIVIVLIVLVGIVLTKIFLNKYNKKISIN